MLAVAAKPKFTDPTSYCERCGELAHDLGWKCPRLHNVMRRAQVGQTHVDVNDGMESNEEDEAVNDAKKPGRDLDKFSAFLKNRMSNCIGLPFSCQYV